MNTKCRITVEEPGKPALTVGYFCDREHLETATVQAVRQIQLALLGVAPEFVSPGIISSRVAEVLKP